MGFLLLARRWSSGANEHKQTGRERERERGKARMLIGEERWHIGKESKRKREEKKRESKRKRV